jgi:hemolysin-activating ACP:hemolysin acyltransferase
MTPKNPPAQLPDVATFSSVLGQAVWLMTVSAKHRDLKVSDIEALVTPAVVLQQFKLYYKGKQPIAFVSWAMVSDKVKARLETGDRHLDASDWRSGSNVVIVECVSPFAERAEIEAQFWQTVKSGLRTQN